MFCRAIVDECQRVFDLMLQYEEVSGQMINASKSSVYFSTNTLTFSRESIKDVLVVIVLTAHEKYLWLPSFIRHFK